MTPESSPKTSIDLTHSIDSSQNVRQCPTIVTLPETTTYTSRHKTGPITDIFEYIEKTPDESTNYKKSNSYPLLNTTYNLEKEHESARSLFIDHFELPESVLPHTDKTKSTESLGTFTSDQPRQQYAYQVDNMRQYNIDQINIYQQNIIFQPQRSLLNRKDKLILGSFTVLTLVGLGTGAGFALFNRNH